MLVRYPQTTSGMLLVNFDPYIFEVIKESEYMIKLNLEIPEAAKVLVHSKDKLKAHFSQMKVWHLYDFLMYTNKFYYKICTALNVFDNITVYRKIHFYFCFFQQVNLSIQNNF